ncbi:MAG TPA: cystathionine gamma-synthase family protein, partial [Myxococcales bacterium]|nr:cystathionine gamma-synthase family protein [Myxococcales bacterium]
MGTTAVWAGEEGEQPYGATVVPVVHSVTYNYDDVDEWFAVATGTQPGHIYSRNTNPTVDALEKKMAGLEAAEDATSFSTGMAAISNTLFTLLSPGDRVVSVKDSYGGTLKVFTDFLPRFGVEVELCETEDHEAIEAAVAKGCKVLYLETPTNPTLKVLDLERLSKAGHAQGATVVVDNT